jgi:hypothetical protein
VDGNVEGNIVRSNTGIVVNTNYGTIVQVQAATPTRRRRPPAPASAPTRHFVGRVAELRRLATNATRGGITVSGSRGVGRSTLLRRLAAEARTPPWDTVIEIRDATNEGAARSVDDLAQRIHDSTFECVPMAKVDASSARAELAGISALVLVEDVGLWGRELERLADVVPDGVVLIETGATAADSSLLDVALGALPRPDAIALLVGVGELTGPTGDGLEAVDVYLDTIAGLLADWPEALVVAGNAMRVRRLEANAALAELRAATTQAVDPAMAALERAWALAQPALDLNARRVLIAAAVLPGGSHDPTILRRVLGAPEWFDDALASLASIGLLFRNSPRLRMPDGIRALLRSHAGDADLATEFADRHLEVVAAVASERILDPDLDPAATAEVLGAFEHAISSGRHELAIELGKAISPRLVLHGLWDAWRAAARGVLSAAELAHRDGDVGWAAHELGTRALVLGDRAEAIELLTEALSIRRRLGDPEGAAYTLHNLARIRPPTPPWWRLGGEGLKRLLLSVGALAVLVVLLGAVGPSLASALFGPAPSASPVATEVAQASPSASASAPPSASTAPSTSPSPTPIPDLVVSTDDGEYKLEGRGWSTTLTVTLTGGQGDYLVVLDDGRQSRRNPSSFPLSGRDCERFNVTGTATSAGAQKTAIKVPVGPPACPTPTPPFETACVTFDNVQVGTTYGLPAGQKPGDEVDLSAEPIRGFVREFEDSNGGNVFSSAMIVEPNPDRGGTPSIEFNELNLEFDFRGLPYVPRKVDFAFSDLNDYHNLSVNGSDIDGGLLKEATTPIGDVSWDWTPQPDRFAIGTLAGPVERFIVGGQKLVIDSVCAHPPA